MAYPVSKKLSRSLALLAGVVALMAGMMAMPAFAADSPSGPDEGEALVSGGSDVVEADTSATDNSTAVLLAGEPQSFAESAGSDLVAVTASSDGPAVEKQIDGKEPGAAESPQAPDQGQEQSASAEVAPADAVAPVAKVPAPAGTGYTGWVVEDRNNGYGLQRYWVVNGKAVTSELLDAAETGWWAYARPEGFVVRGRWTDPSNGYVYLANNDGRLEGLGWVVTSGYGQGLQRYWVDAEAHAAVPGYSSDGWAHYTLADGTVLRGVSILGDGTFYRANNDGKILDSTESMKGYIGWWVTSSLGHGLQRYWLNSGKLALSTLIDPALGHGAYWAYARPEGFVVRGKWDKGNGRVYVADNDGALPSVSGWMVTGKYDGGALQRYYMDGDAHAAVTSFFTVGGNLYYGIGWQGYVLRNSSIGYNGSVYVADNDGVLTKQRYSPLIQSMVDRAQGFSSSTGWLVLVSRSDCHVAVFSGGRGNWGLYDDFACVVGASSSPTITGTYTTRSRRPSLDTDSRARYCTQIHGGYFFHTILSSNSELGHWASHGCVRLPVEKARWIYYNLPLGSTVNIY